MNSHKMKVFLTAALSIMMTLAVTAQDGPPAGGTPAGGPAGARPGGASQDPQPYDKVITKDAKSKKGVFTVHQIKDKFFYEIPQNEIDKEFLWVTQIAKTTLGVGYGGQAMGSRVVRWEKRNDTIHLRVINYNIVADSNDPIHRAVEAANTGTILLSFPVAAYGENNAPVIDVTRLYTTDILEISARRRLNANALDASRTYLERISPYPTNIEAVATHTYTRAAAPAGAGGMGGGAQSSGMNPGSATVVMHYSMIKLPENPMMPRLYDDRVGYFSVRNTDFSRPEHRAQQRRFITRWRLEKKDPNAAVSEPVKPIVYWIDSATPTWLIPFVKNGVEKWQKAFEAAGFKNAIIAKMAPTPEQDPDFSPEDARYSVIRWLPSNIENASGPHINDPRTGEILESDIQMYHNIMNLQRSWYFTQVGPLDSRVHKLPMPNDLMGVLVEYVVAHEVGHTLGFQHNMKASSSYTIEQIRDPKWVKEMGHVATMMDYSRFNYVAQPEDKMPLDLLVPGIGPYDVWATKWGYAPITKAKSSDEEKPTLDSWAREQDEKPWLRFSTSGSAGSDPGELTEAVGDLDAIRATELGIKNLKRVNDLLIPATTTQPGETYSDLSELYGRMLGQWTLELNHVSAIVGGFNTRQLHVGQKGLPFVPVPKDRQVAAVRFLNQNAFETPTWALNTEILRRIEPIGALNRIRNSQRTVLNNLLSSARFARLIEQQAVDGNASYQPGQFLADVRNGVWKELDGSSVNVDAYRRNLQRSYLEIANTKVNQAAAPAANVPAQFAAMMISSGDERAFYRSELRALDAKVAAAISKAADATTRIHLEGVRDHIATILNPNAPKVLLSADNPAIQREIQLMMMTESTSCWPDFNIQPF